MRIHRRHAVYGRRMMLAHQAASNCKRGSLCMQYHAHWRWFADEHLPDSWQAVHSRCPDAKTSPTGRCSPSAKRRCGCPGNVLLGSTTAPSVFWRRHLLLVVTPCKESDV